MINQDKRRRRSIRLRDYDYSQPGAYFATICTKDRQCLFGDVIGGEMRLNEFGQIVEYCWEWLENQYEYVELDAYVVMPNHLHGIILIMDDRRRGGSRTAPTTKRKSLGRLIGAFKTVSTKSINKTRGIPNSVVWQRNYYEHVIRNEDELNEIREYIANNPLKWESDEENPDVYPMAF